MSRGGVTEGGARLCAEESWREMIRPVISAPEEDCFDLKNASYAMGWLNADYRGTNVVFHSGGLSGFNTQVGFLPGTGDGYCLCFNTGSTPAHRVARAILLDSLVDGEPKASYDGMIDAWLKERDEMREKMAKNRDGKPLTAKSDPMLPGVYRHPAYETFEIREQDGVLRFLYGDFEATLVREADGRVTGYTGALDGLVPAAIELFPDGDGDLRRRMPDSGGLKLPFRRES